MCFFPINPILDKLGHLHVYRGFRNEFVDFCKKCFDLVWNYIKLTEYLGATWQSKKINQEPAYIQ